MNSRSICNKSWLINDFITDHNVDLFALSETWLRGDDSDLHYIRDICPNGYVFHHVPRLHTTGGGVGTVFKNNVKEKIQAHESYRPISSVTSHHVTLRTGGQASVCLQHGGESDYEAWVVTRLF